MWLEARREFRITNGTWRPDCGGERPSTMKIRATKAKQAWLQVARKSGERATTTPRIFADPGVSGTRASRPELDKMLDHLREGDEVVVWKLDRAGAYTRNPLALIDDLEHSGRALP